VQDFIRIYSRKKREMFLKASKLFVSKQTVLMIQSEFIIIEITNYFIVRIVCRLLR
jgi:hypothetical protein